MESLLSPPGYSKISGGGGRQSSLETTDASTPTTGGPLRRRISVRTNRSRHQSGMQGGQPAVQLLSIPQLDAIQRILRILDVRLQHVQSNVKDDVRMRTDVDHIRRLMSENQNALSTVVTVLSSIQEEVSGSTICIYLVYMVYFVLVYFVLYCKLLYIVASFNFDIVEFWPYTNIL